MIDTGTCEWLLKNADAPIRYRTARELLKDEKLAEQTENELFDNATVKLWLKRLKPEITPKKQVVNLVHGAPDAYLENTMTKVTQLGLHAEMPLVAEAVQAFMEIVHNTPFRKPYRKLNFYLHQDLLLLANMLTLGGVKDEKVLEFMLGSLDEIYGFAQKGGCDIYLSKEERAKLKGVPPNYEKIEHFTRPELFEEFGIGWPLIYDIIGWTKLYGVHSTETDRKIDAVIGFIASDEFHNAIPNGYGILMTTGKTKYYAHGWDPKYPGWFDVAFYIENAVDRGGTTTPPWSVSKLLFYAMYICKYPVTLKTQWFSYLLNYLEKYKTEVGTYIFPEEWLREGQGYTVLGRHMSFGENRRKENWCEIESTFYMQLLQNSVG